MRGRRRVPFRELAAALISAVVTVGLWGAGGPQPAGASGTPKLRWLAAGDSYASGQGLPNLETKCARAKAPNQNWAEVAAGLLARAGYDFATPRMTACTGATTRQFFHPKGKLPPQWTAKMGRFNLVTFSFGGDNVDFATVVASCVTTHSICTDTYVRKKIRHFAKTYSQFLHRVAAKAVTKDGNVVVMGYPELVETPSLWPVVNHVLHRCQGLTIGVSKRIRGWAGDLNATIGYDVNKADNEPASHRNGVNFTFIDVVSGNDGLSRSDPDLFEPATGTRHELCSDGDRNWLNGLVVPKGLNAMRGNVVTQRSMHPTQAGETAMGNLAATVIGRLTWPSSPTLGIQWPKSLGLGQYEGYGSVEPTTIQNGVGPTSYASSIAWESWGGAEATGVGDSSYTASAPATAVPAQATIVAYDPGTCDGHYAYRDLTYYFPEYGQTFRPTDPGWVVCPPSSPPTTQPTSSPGTASCSTAAIMAAVEAYLGNPIVPGAEATGSPTCKDGWAALMTQEVSNGQVLGPDMAIASSSGGSWTVVSYSEGYLCSSLPPAAVQALGTAANCIKLSTATAPSTASSTAVTGTSSSEATTSTAASTTTGT